VENITKKKEFCKFNPEPSDCDKTIIEIKALGGALPLTIHAEVGCNYDFATDLPSKFIPYAGISFIKEEEIGRYHLLLAIDKNKYFNGAIGYQFPFINFPLDKKNPFSRWQKPTTTVTQKYMRMYVGTTLRVNTARYNTVDQDLHLGLSVVNFNDRSFIRYIFIQFGIMYDYIGHRTYDFNSIAQVGANFKLIQFKSETL
jgi:hypothetical protein